MSSQTLNHLAADTQKLLELSDEQRAAHMLVDRFIKHDRLDFIWDHIEFLRYSPTTSRAAGLVVYGPPGSGKTMLATAALRRHPTNGASPTKAATRPILTINMTGAREAKILYNRMLEALECPLAARWTGSDRERLVLKLCRAADLKMLIVDEIQDILTSTPRQQAIALDTIKHLMNELHVPVLALGTEAAKAAMEVDQHLNARFSYRPLPVWKADAYLAKFLDALETRLPLRLRSCLSAPSLMKALVAESGGRLDLIVRRACWAAAHAVEQGVERVTLELIAHSAQVPPITLLRKQAEVNAAARAAVVAT